jgi:hypothetical protein
VALLPSTTLLQRRTEQACLLYIWEFIFGNLLMCVIISKGHPKMHLGTKRETGMVRKDNLKDKSCDHDGADIPIHVYSMLSDLIKQIRHALACVGCSSPHRQILFELCINIPLEILSNHSGRNNICSRKIFHESSWTDSTTLKA